jgi:hypothetical protein
MEVVRKDLEEDAPEDPTVYDRWLARCRTIADCSGPTAESIQGALVEVRHKARADLRAWTNCTQRSLGLGYSMNQQQNESPDLYHRVSHEIRHHLSLAEC